MLGSFVFFPSLSVVTPPLFMWAQLLFFSVLVACSLVPNVDATCSSTVILSQATDCGSIVTWPWNVTDVFPANTTTERVYALDGYNCTGRVTVPTLTLAAGRQFCGAVGQCSTVYPYACICPFGTSGSHCCPVNYFNGSSIPTLPCNGRGACTLGGVCECRHGYGGVWCCPTEPYSGLTCGSSGCCMSNGHCSCTNGSGLTGVACERYTSASGSTTLADNPGVVAAIVVGAIMGLGVLAVAGYYVGAVVYVGSMAYAKLPFSSLRLVK